MDYILLAKGLIACFRLADTTVVTGTVIYTVNFNRNVCAQHLVDYPSKIGWPDIEVQVRSSYAAAPPAAVVTIKRTRP